MVTDPCDIYGRERAQHMEIVGVGRVCPISGTTFRPKFDREAAERAGAQAERERIIRALGIYQEWCDGWGLTKNLNMTVRVAAECARMVRVLPDDLPADDEDAGDKITKAIRAVSDQERA